MRLRNLIDGTARPLRVVGKVQQMTNIFYREAKVTRAPDELKPSEAVGIIAPLPTGRSLRAG